MIKNNFKQLKEGLLILLVVIFFASCNDTEAYFTADTYTCYVGDTVHFTNKSSNYKSLEWDFGEFGVDNNIIEENPEFYWDYPGTKTVRLYAFAKAGHGATGIYSDEITVITRTSEKYYGNWSGEVVTEQDDNGGQSENAILMINTKDTSYDFEITGLLRVVVIKAEDNGANFSIEFQNDNDNMPFSGSGYILNDSLFINLEYNTINKTVRFAGVKL